MLGAILVAAAAFWRLDYQPYILPSSDFFRIRDTALALVPVFVLLAAAQFTVSAHQPMLEQVATVIVANRASVARGLLAAGVVAALVVTPVTQGAGHLARLMTNVYYDKAELVAVLGGLADNMEPRSSVAIARFDDLRDDMPSITADRVVRFSEFEAVTHEAFLIELAERGIEYVVFLHRAGLTTDPNSPLYGRSVQTYHAAKVYSMEPFRSGEEVAGFEKLVAIPPPHRSYGNLRTCTGGLACRSHRRRCMTRTAVRSAELAVIEVVGSCRSSRPSASIQPSDAARARPRGRAQAALERAYVGLSHLRAHQRRDAALREVRRTQPPASVHLPDWCCTTRRDGTIRSRDRRAR